MMALLPPGSMIHPPTNSAHVGRPPTRREDADADRSRPWTTDAPPTNRKRNRRSKSNLRRVTTLTWAKKRSFIGLRFQTHERLTDQIHDSLFPTRIRRESSGSRGTSSRDPSHRTYSMDKFSFVFLFVFIFSFLRCVKVTDCDTRGGNIKKMEMSYAWCVLPSC